MRTNPPTGGGTGKRRRPKARYASDALVDRAAELSLKHGVKLRLTPDGGVEILGKLDSLGPGGAGSGPEGETADEALAAWKAEHEPARRA
jgi:hypothetical protein